MTLPDRRHDVSFDPDYFAIKDLADADSAELADGAEDSLFRRPA